MLDLILAIAHHLAVFTLVALFAAEFALLRPGIEAKRIAQLARIDGAYGAMAGIVILIGVTRVIFGNAGWEYYVGNWAFWVKMAAFLAVGLLSIRPTVAFVAWRKQLTANPSFAPADGEVKSLRTFIHLQAAALLFIPVFAAMIPRIYGI